MGSKTLDGLEDETVTISSTSDASAPAGLLQAVVLSASQLEIHMLPEVGTRTIGRFSRSGIAIDHETISRFHAVLHVGPQLQIEDCGSANGTSIEGVRVPPNTLVKFELGSVIKLGSVVLVVQRRPRK